LEGENYCGEQEQKLKEASTPGSGTTKPIQQVKEKVAPAPIAQVKQEQQQKGKPFNKELQKELQKQQKAFEHLENEIAKLKNEMLQLEASLALPETYNDKTKFKKAEDGYAFARKQMEKLQAEYELVFEKMMELEEALKA
jgi:ATP-binding cassette, subfamily F, member 3